MALPGLRLLEASGLTPVLTGKRWAEDLLAGTGWRFEPIEGHVTEDLDRMRNIARRWGGHPKGLLFPNSFSSALLYRIGGIRSAGFQPTMPFLHQSLEGCTMGKRSTGNTSTSFVGRFVTWE